MFKNILYLYPTTIKTIKSRQKRPIKIINEGFGVRFEVRFVIEGKEFTPVEDPVKRGRTSF